MIANDVIGAFRFVRPPIGEKDISRERVLLKYITQYSSRWKQQIDVTFICCVPSIFHTTTAESYIPYIDRLVGNKSATRQTLVQHIDPNIQ